MLVAQYTHRLPTDYDVGRIAERASLRGPLWDGLAGLVFKAFMLQEHGAQGAPWNAYSSLYLWRDTGGLTNMLTGESMAAVVEAFGRPVVELSATVSSFVGQDRDALVAVQETSLIPPEQNLSALAEQERDWTRRMQNLPGVTAALSAMNVTNWTLTRSLVGDAKMEGPKEGARFKVAYLAWGKAGSGD